MSTPKTDDFRVEKRDDGIAVVFTPTGRTYTYSLKNESELSEPTVSPAQAESADYAEDDIRKTATAVAKLAVSGAPRL